MCKIALMLKTYQKDYHYALRLLKSYHYYNVEDIPLFLVAPESTVGELLGKLQEDELVNIKFIPEEKLDVYFTTKAIHGLSVGYINQAIVKFAFWELGLCENYMCIDSEAVFIRPFYKSDFMYSEDVPYTVLLQDKWLMSDPDYYENFWRHREKWLKKIEDAIDYHNPIIKTCHGFQIFSSVVLRDFKNSFMKVHGYNYTDVMNIAPYAFSWYCYWLQKTKVIEIHEIDQLFCTFHLRKDVNISMYSDRTIEDLARSYLGFVINSNYLNGKMVEYNSGSFKKETMLSIVKHVIKKIVHDRK